MAASAGSNHAQVRVLAPRATRSQPRIDASSLIPISSTIKALNSKVRRAVRVSGHFLTDEAALKLVFLVLNRAEKEWSMAAREQ